MKRMISLVMCLVMVLCMVPTPTMADPLPVSVTIGGAEIYSSDTTTYAWVSDSNAGSSLIATGTSTYTDNYAEWNGSSNTLTLHNFSATFTNIGYAIYISSNVNSTIVVTGTNTINISYSGGIAYGIFYASSECLTVKGDGSLTIKASAANCIAYGIDSGGSLAIPEKTIFNITATSQDASAYDIFAENGDITISNGIFAISAASQNSCAYGICSVCGDIIISGGTFNNISATSNCANEEGEVYGIYAQDGGGNITISGGTFEKIFASGTTAACLYSKSSTTVSRTSLSVRYGNDASCTNYLPEASYTNVPDNLNCKYMTIMPFTPAYTPPYVEIGGQGNASKRYTVWKTTSAGTIDTVTGYLTYNEVPISEDSYALWDASETTLTLKNFKATFTDAQKGIEIASSSSVLSPKIILEGDNAISVATSTSFAYGISYDGSGCLYVNGDGSLTIVASSTSTEPYDKDAYGINSEGSLAISSETTFNIKANSANGHAYAIYAYKDVTISNSTFTNISAVGKLDACSVSTGDGEGDITINSGTFKKILATSTGPNGVVNGIFSWNVTINGGTFEKISADANGSTDLTTGISAHFKLVVNGGTFNDISASGTHAYGISSSWKDVSISNATFTNITVSGTDAYGIKAKTNVTIGNATFTNITVNGVEAYGLYAPNVMTISSTTSIKVMARGTSTSTCLYASEISIDRELLVKYGKDGSDASYTNVLPEASYTDVTVNLTDYPYMEIKAFSPKIYIADRRVVNQRYTVVNTSADGSVASVIGYDSNPTLTSSYALWDAANATLTLNNFTATSTNVRSVIDLEASITNITIVVSGTNIINATYHTDATGTDLCGIDYYPRGYQSLDGQLNVIGDGTLKIVGTIVGDDNYAYGIYCYNRLNLASNTTFDFDLTASGTNAEAYGICSRIANIKNSVFQKLKVTANGTAKSIVGRNLTISKAKFDEISAYSKDFLAIGIHVDNLTIKGTTFTDFNVNACYFAYGLFSQNLTMSDSRACKKIVVTAPEGQAVGLFTASNTNISNSAFEGFTVVASGTSCGIYMFEQLTIDQSIFGNFNATSTNKTAMGIMAVTGAVTIRNSTFTDMNLVSAGDAYGIVANQEELLIQQTTFGTITVKGPEEVAGLYAFNMNLINNNFKDIIAEDSKFGRGLYAKGDITTENTTITVHDKTDGIMANGSVKISTNSNIIVYDIGSASAPNCDPYPTCAIHANEDVIIQNSIVLASSTSAYGIYAGDLISVTKSTVKAIGGAGAASATTIKFSGTASRKMNGSSIEPFVSSRLAYYHYISTDTYVYYGGVTYGYTITSKLGAITKVTVDGVTLDSIYYTVSGGNVYLTQAYLNTLANGKHTVKLYNGTKTATATITVSNSNVVKSSKTGDPGVLLYAGLAISSILGLGYIKKKDF